MACRAALAIDKGMMVRASAVISMFFAGSVISTWAYQLEQREN
jgi:hypothetical protein